MVRSKKGFIRILEAIIAVLLVFGYVVTILPKTEKNIAQAPPEMETTLQAVTDAVQTNERLRAVVLDDNINTVDASEHGILNTFIDDSLPVFSRAVWGHAFSVCQLCSGAALPQRICKYFPQTDPLQQPPKQIISDNDFTDYLSNQAPAIFTKSTLLSTHDVTSSPLTPKEVPPANCYRTFTLYMWTKL